MNCLLSNNLVKYSYERFYPYQNMRRDSYGNG